jgi:murein DD-endopeptidase MepM/ murein hydrolase activator NlpD
MRNRLLITLALGVLAAVLSAGAVGAQSVGESQGVTVDLPGGTTTTAQEALPVCINTVDDDGDGLVDFPNDPGCADATDGDETDPVTTVPADTGTEPADTTTEDPADTATAPVDENFGEEPADTGEKVHDFGDDSAASPEHSFGSDGDQAATPEHSFGSAEADQQNNDPDAIEVPEIRTPDGAPTNSNPTVTVADLGAAPVGVPNFIIDKFSIPPFLLPIYQACGTQYGIPWNVLASINRIETAFGTNLNVSTAGALGWMQFMPATWEMYGVDANGDGRKDPYNPVDAICAAARYLKAAGGEQDLYRAIFAYNHADWYVDEVLLYAKQYGSLPSGLVDSLVGLTEGAHFPVAAKARYADDISEREAIARATPKKGTAGNVSDVISDSPTRRGIDIFAKDGAPVVAVNDGVVKKIGKNEKLGRYIVLQDAYGNEFTYAELGSTSKLIPVPQERQLSSKDFDLITPGEGDKKPTVEASDTTRAAASDSESKADGDTGDTAAPVTDTAGGPENTEDARARLYALPERPENRDRADLTGQLDSLLGKGMPGYETFKSYFSGVLHFDEKTMDTEALHEGSQVVAGTVLGRIGESDDGTAAHVNFAIAPAGRGSQTIDPKPILDGWKLLEATAIYRAAGKNPFTERASVGQVLLASKSQLQRQVLNDPNLEIYSCGREDIQAGRIDRRVLATLEYLVQRGFRLTITSLECGHSTMTTSGNISEHSTGNAVDIAAVNGIPIYGNQGKGSITEAVINELLKLQGPMAPHQIISLMEMGGPTFAMADHDDHIHVGFQELYGQSVDGQPLNESMLAPGQWDKLLDRISELDEPTVATKPSKFALPADKGDEDRASSAHLGE